MAANEPRLKKPAGRGDVGSSETGSIMTAEVEETAPLLDAGVEEQDEPPDDNLPRRESSMSYTDFEHMPWWRRPSIYWLIGPYFLFALAFGGVIVPKLNLIVDLVCRQYFADRGVLVEFSLNPSRIELGGDNPQCKNAGVQRDVATFTLVLSVLTGILSAITAPRLGALSDRFGRTRLLTVASCGGVLNEITTILAAKYPDTVDYHWIILGAFFDGVTGSFTAGAILSSSYTSDCTPPSKRGIYIGYLHACLFTGLAFGPLLAGYFVKFTGSLLSIFYVSLGCHIFFILFIFFITPESLSKKRQLHAREEHRVAQEALAERMHSHIPNTFGRLMGRYTGSFLQRLLNTNPLAPLKILAPTGRENGPLRRNLIILAVSDAVMLSAAMGSGTVVVLYVEYVFSWGNFEASRFVSLISFIRVIVLLGIFPFVSWYFRLRRLNRQRRESGLHLVETNAGADELDIWMLRFALMSDVAGVVGYVFVRTQELFVFFGILTAFGGMGSAIIQSSITKHVPTEHVGSLLGAIGLLHALGRVIAPILFNGVYAATVGSYPQAFFVLLISLFGLTLMGSLFVRPHVFLRDGEPYKPVPTTAPELEGETTAEAAGALPTV